MNYLHLVFYAAGIFLILKLIRYGMAIVFLLGPAPGILIGIFCLLFYSVSKSEILKQSGVFLIVLNYLNLLPILPLDGGRVFEVTLFSRIHYLKSAFLIASIGVLAVAGVYKQDYPLMVIALLLGLGVRNQIVQNRAMSRLDKKIQSERIERTEKSLVPAILHLLREEPYRAMPFQRKVSLARDLLGHSMAQPAGASAIAVSLLLYLLVWLLPLFAGMAFIIIGFVRGMRQGF